MLDYSQLLADPDQAIYFVAKIKGDAPA